MNQKGKTLLELLVSLAIMGVLSISVLFGLRSVWERHRSNQILDDTMLMFSQMASLETTGNQVYHPDFTPQSGHQLVGWKDQQTEDAFVVTVYEISFSECERILQMDSMIIQGVTKDGEETNACTDGVDMTFISAPPATVPFEETQVIACDWSSGCCTNGVRFRWWGRWYCGRRWIPWWWK